MGRHTSRLFASGRIPSEHPLAEGRDYIRINQQVLKRTRNSQGILIGTARTNPARTCLIRPHFKDPERAKALRTVYDALISIGVDALISIGGDDTWKTANKFKLFQEQLPQAQNAFPWFHLPKTIDNDYSGIDFTFGYFTAVECIGRKIRNLLADAEAAEQTLSPRQWAAARAGWLMGGHRRRSQFVISVEDVTGKYEMSEEVTIPRRENHPAPRDESARGGQPHRGHNARPRRGGARNSA